MSAQVLSQSEFDVPNGVRTLDHLLNRVARVLQIGAVVNAALAGLILLASLIASAQLIPGLFGTLHQLLVRSIGGADDAAVAAAALLCLLNMSLLLVVNVGALAREVWTIPGLIGLAAANIAALLMLGFTPALITGILCVIALVMALRSGTGDAGLLRAFRINPVMLKELRGRMRGVRAFVVLTVYLGLMGGFAMLLYLVYSTAGRDPGSAAAGEIGRVLFNGVFAVELLLIIFIAPAFTAGAITGERERQTYDLLRTTLLSSASFVIGKLESALGYVLLLLLAGIPLQAFAFLFGGISEEELVLSLLILLVTAIALGTVGIYFSAGLSRTLTASVRAYSVTLVMMFIAPALLAVVLNIIHDVFYGSAALSVNQSPVVESVLVYIGHVLTSINPLATAIGTQNLLVTQQVAGFYPYTLTSNGSTIPLASPWINFTILYLSLAAVLMALTIRVTRRLDEMETERLVPSSEE